MGRSRDVEGVSKCTFVALCGGGFAQYLLPFLGMEQYEDMTAGLAARGMAKCFVQLPASSAIAQDLLGEAGLILASPAWADFQCLCA